MSGVRPRWAAVCRLLPHHSLGTSPCAARPEHARCTQQRHSSSISTATRPPPTPHTRCHKVIFSGIQPTGIPHLGNYLGALRRWVQLQDEAASEPATQLYYSVVDLHALTSFAASSGGSSGGEVLRQRRRETLAMFLAIGLDPERCVLFYQSAVPAHAELMWLLSCTASVGALSRMTQWKSKLKQNNDGAARTASTTLRLGLLSYPVLQAADILVHGATHVPVGDDQSQHLEFARTCAAQFNHVCGQPLLRAPATLLSPARRIMSLQQPAEKMSKSHPDARGQILLTDDAAELRAKIASALTDNTNAVSYDRAARPGVANLLEMLVLAEEDPRTADDLAARAKARAQELAGQPLRVLKDRLADAVVHRLTGIRERFTGVLTRDGGAYLDRVAAHGATKARANAAETMDAVREAMGL